MSQNTQNIITQVAIPKNGTGLNASPVAAIFSAVATRLNCIRTLSAAGVATSKDALSDIRPNVEPIILARKPLSEATVAANVLRWGTGAINVDGCRVATDELTPRNNSAGEHLYKLGFEKRATVVQPSPLGRWPANVITDGSEEVVRAFPETTSGLSSPHHKDGGKTNHIFGEYAGRGINQDFGGDSGSAARFFYSAKADGDDRLGSKHPTVKPVDLMQYLVRLITPPRGMCLDPFAGTGSTGEAAWREGMSAILIEREDEYCADICRRMQLALAGPDERLWQSIKARGQVESPGPLFEAIEYDAEDDFARSIDEAYAAIRARKAAGGKGWPE